MRPIRIPTITKPLIHLFGNTGVVVGGGGGGGIWIAEALHILYGAANSKKYQVSEILVIINIGYQKY